MGKLALAAKITHVPSMYLSELDGPRREYLRLDHPLVQQLGQLDAAHDAFRAALDRLSAGGSTAGGAGLKLAYQVARDNFIDGGVNRILLATDGDGPFVPTLAAAAVRASQRRCRGLMDASDTEAWPRPRWRAGMRCCPMSLVMSLPKAQAALITLILCWMSGDLFMVSGGMLGCC